MRISPLLQASLILSLPFWSLFVNAQSSLPPHLERDIVTLSADASTTVVPDMALIQLAIERQGSDPANLTQEVNQIMNQALAQAKSSTGIEAQTSSFTTYPRYDNKGQRNGWIVRAELILKSKDFGVLGTLAGKLSNQLQIIGNSFEVSRSLRLQQEASLQEQAIRAFQQKAESATKQLGYRSWQLRELTIGQQQGELNRPMPRGPMLMKAASAEAAPMNLEAGNTSLNLVVNGSIVMQR
ncbi:SIMPL domain-containing protein [Parvibium lacunae]|uniref:DUF541 domain-containing protein n=1 Tax=Parvibium lacunae TaxID=1888893 RepID=A0A368L1N0_9BURK|nr:SIMPL domain-containing protein [Parvibium lacunae]RCS57464.1 DUF541 domain-containing protein [Parvibium lacunae]